MLDWASQVLTLPGKFAAQLNRTFASHQFAHPCLNAMEEILLQQKHLQYPSLLVIGTSTSSGLLHPPPRRSGKQCIRILGLQSLELGVVTPGLLWDYFWHDDREIWNKKLKIACDCWSRTILNAWGSCPTPLKRPLHSTLLCLCWHLLHRTSSAALGLLTLVPRYLSLSTMGSEPWNQLSVTSKTRYTTEAAVSKLAEVAEFCFTL